MHRMHLKGPWRYEWLDRASQENQQGTKEGRECSAGEGRVKLPADWRSLFGNQPGVVRFSRRFGRPTNLEPGERVFLVFDGIAGEAQVTLNDHRLGATEENQQTAEFDVTHYLNSRNQLTVDVQFEPARSDDRPGGLWAPVAIEIRSEGG